MDRLCYVVFSRTRRFPVRFIFYAFGYSIVVGQPYSTSVREALRFCGESELDFIKCLVADPIFL